MTELIFQPFQVYFMLASLKLKAPKEFHLSVVQYVLRRNIM